MGHVMRKCVLCHMRTTKVQISLRSLVSTFVVRCLDSMICILAIAITSRLWLVSVAEQAGMRLTWSQTPKKRVSRDVAHIIFSGF